MSTDESAPAELSMVFDPNTIDHLGIRLYSQLPAALNELVTNAYDADSKIVEIAVPTGDIDAESAIEVVDRGHGMTRDEVKRHYLVIGRDRRQDEECSRSPEGRKVTGRKGLGKLAAFGVARIMDVRTVRDGRITAISLDYQEMKKMSGAYKPTLLSDDNEATTDAPGTTITLRSLKRKTPIKVEEIVQGLGKRLTLLDDDFKVTVNGSQVVSASKHDREDCEDGMFWNVDDLPDTVKALCSNEIRGWFGFIKESKQTERGVNIYAHKKAAEVGSFFGYSGTTAQFARSYLVGEIHADFLDGDVDLVATARTGIVWEEPTAAEFQKWGQAALRWLFGEWAKKRRARREKAIYEGAGFKEWLATRDSREQKIATKTLGLLLDDDRMSEERAIPLVEIVKASVESKAFDELLVELEGLGANAPAETLLRLFKDWSVIEAREFLRIFRGRLESVVKLEQALGTEALEVEVMQPLLYENLWILDPGWKRADREMYYSKLAREYADKQHPPNEANKRLDVFAVRASGRMSIIEVKRANKKLEADDIEQIRGYRRYVENLGNSSSRMGPANVDALLVVGEMNTELARDVEDARRTGIEIATWADLCHRARAIYEEYRTALEIAAPEYAKAFDASLNPPSTSS